MPSLSRVVRPPGVARRAALALRLALAPLGLAACGDSTAAHTGVPDHDGLADLVVDRPALERSIIIDEESFGPGNCSAVEGHFAPGRYRVLRFTVWTDNIGTADAYIGDPLVHLDPNGDGDTTDTDGLFEWAPCHGHIHFRHYARYELVPVTDDSSLGAPHLARKAGFCMRDDLPLPGTDPRSWVYRNCGSLTQHGDQGIAKGWADVYDRSLDGQFFLLSDPADPVPPGPYLIRITVNPPFTRQAPTDPCPIVDPDGNCRLLEESDYSNNTVTVPVTIAPSGAPVVVRRAP